MILMPGMVLRTSWGMYTASGPWTAVAFRQATCHSGVDTVWASEFLLVICSAENPTGHYSEEGIDPKTHKPWARRWYLLLRPSGRLCWVNEMQLQMYEVISVRE